MNSYDLYWRAKTMLENSTVHTETVAINYAELAMRRVRMQNPWLANQLRDEINGYRRRNVIPLHEWRRATDEEWTHD